MTGRLRAKDSAGDFRVVKGQAGGDEVGLLEEGFEFADFQREMFGHERASWLSHERRTSGLDLKQAKFFT